MGETWGSTGARKEKRGKDGWRARGTRPLAPLRPVEDVCDVLSPCFAFFFFGIPPQHMLPLSLWTSLCLCATATWACLLAACHSDVVQSLTCLGGRGRGEVSCMHGHSPCPLASKCQRCQERQKQSTSRLSVRVPENSRFEVLCRGSSTVRSTEYCTYCSVPVTPVTPVHVDCVGVATLVGMTLRGTRYSVVSCLAGNWKFYLRCSE